MSDFQFSNEKFANPALTGGDLGSSGNNFLRVEDVRKSFGDNDVLKGITTLFRRNEVVSIIGPSGGGKSTFLRCLNLLEKPTSGKIFLDDIELTHPNVDVNAQRRKIGMVFQQFNLFNNMSVGRNLTEAPERILKMSHDEAHAKAQALLAKVGLADRMDSYPRQLSGGQKQRVAIARSLMMNPEVMLFDEPTSALDPETVGDVLDVMRDLAVEGMTMIVVTHEMRFAREVADRTIFLAGGIIEEDRLSGELFDSPVSPRLASFLEKVL